MMNRSTIFALLIAMFACVAVKSVHAAEREYFWNEVTNATQWEEPTVPVPHEDTETGKKYYVDPKTGESVWEVSDEERSRSLLFLCNVAFCGVAFFCRRGNSRGRGGRGNVVVVVRV